MSIKSGEHKEGNYREDRQQAVNSDRAPWRYLSNLSSLRWDASCDAFLDTPGNLPLLLTYREMAKWSTYGKTKSLSSGPKIRFFNHNFIKKLEGLLGGFLLDLSSVPL
jgi:hypothetical protein